MALAAVSGPPERQLLVVIAAIALWVVMMLCVMLTVYVVYVGFDVMWF